MTTTPRPTRRIRATLVRHKLAATVTALALVAAVAAGGATAIGDAGGQTERVEQSVAEPKVLAVPDGSLTVDKASIEQMVGNCDGSSCYHVPPAKPVTVKATQGAKLPMKAGVSKAFTVAAYNLDKPTQPAPVTLQDGKLVLGQMNPGTYSVTVAGQPNGGMWQFTLKVAQK